MHNRFRTPPQELILPDITPLVFLAGPIQGAQDWQSDVASRLLNVREDIIVASPRNPGERLPYDEQADWEKQHILRSRNLGAIAFWFAEKDAELPYEPGRAYAQTTRIELGRAIGWLDFIQFPVIVGIDENYEGSGGGSSKYFRNICAEKGLPIHNTLDKFTAAIAEQTPAST